MPFAICVITAGDAIVTGGKRLCLKRTNTIRRPAKAINASRKAIALWNRGEVEWEDMLTNGC